MNARLVLVLLLLVPVPAAAGEPGLHVGRHVYFGEAQDGMREIVADRSTLLLALSGTGAIENVTRKALAFEVRAAKADVVLADDREAFLAIRAREPLRLDLVLPADVNLTSARFAHARQGVRVLWASSLDGGALTANGSRLHAELPKGATLGFGLARGDLDRAFAGAAERFPVALEARSRGTGASFEWVAFGAPGGALRGGARLEANPPFDPDSYAIARIRAEGVFAVDRPEQVVPFLGPSSAIFRPVAAAEIAELSPSAKGRYVNASGDAASQRLLLAVPPGSRGPLVLAPDVEPPRLARREVRGLTSYNVTLETATTEDALATLVIKGGGRKEPLVYPTTVPSVRQTFPVLGLQPNRVYTYTFTFVDLAGNVNVTSPENLVTPVAPGGVPPTVTARSPQDGATPLAPVREIVAFYKSEDAPILTEKARLFVDKEEVTKKANFSTSTARYRPDPPLGPGLHTVTLEIVTAEGDSATSSWSFTALEPEKRSPVPVALAAIAVVAGALLAPSLRDGRKGR